MSTPHIDGRAPRDVSRAFRGNLPPDHWFHHTHRTYQELHQPAFPNYLRVCPRLLGLETGRVVGNMGGINYDLMNAEVGG